MATAEVFDEVQHSKVQNSPLIPIVLCICIIVFLLLIPLVHKKDRFYKMRQKEIIGLEDNRPHCKYHYLITVSTGFRRGSGTTSHVAIRLYGSLGLSSVHLLASRSRLTLQTAQTDTFILSTRKGLGNIAGVYLFHDSFGSSPTWNLRDIVVRDLQMGKQWHFIGNRWLTTEGQSQDMKYFGTSTLLFNDEFEEDDSGTLDFQESLSHRMADDHLFFSVFHRTAFSPFTCVQRLGVAFCLLLTWMLVNLLFYRRTADVRTETGSYTFSLSEVVIGVQSAAAAFLLPVIITLLFKRSGTPAKTEWNRSRSNASPILFLGLGWTLLSTISIFFSYLIILIGTEFGPVTSSKWFTSFCATFFIGVVILETLKVLFLAILDKLNTKKTKSSRNVDLEDVEHIESPHNKDSKVRHPIFKVQKEKYYHTLPPIVQKAIRVRLQTDAATRHRLRQLLFFCAFFAGLWTIASRFRNPSAFFETSASRMMFVKNAGFGGGRYVGQVAAIRDLNKLYDHLSTSTLVNIHRSTAHDPDNPNDEETMADGVHVLLGVPRLRQIRVKKGDCKVTMVLRSFIEVCNPVFDSKYEDTDSYNQGWNPGTGNEQKEWSHSENSAEVNVDGELSLSYPGHGYIVDLGQNLANSRAIIEHLRKNNWLDGSTRAIFLEFVSYNVNSNMFTAASIAFEVSAVGSIYRRLHVHPFRPITFVTDFDVLFIIIALIVIISVFGYASLHITRIYRYRKSYFADRWNFLSLLIIATCFTLMAIELQYVAVVRFLLRRLDDEKRNVYIDFGPAVRWDDACILAIGLLVALVSLKFWHVLSFNRHMRSFLMTIQYSGIPLVNFTLMFAVVFIAFVFGGHLLLGNDDPAMSTVLRAGVHFLVFAVGTATAGPYLKSQNTIIGLGLYILFIGVVYFYFANLFAAIVTRGFEQARKRIGTTHNAYNMCSYLMTNYVPKPLLRLFGKSSDVPWERRRKQRIATWLTIESKLDEMNVKLENLVKELEDKN